MFIFSYCWYFGGSLGTAVVVGGIFTIFEVIVYASLISAMPRAGGDYVWQSRILGRGIGFLLSVTGWWFILWLWVPLYGQILTYEFLTPMAALLGAPEAALWFTGTTHGSAGRHAAGLSHRLHLYCHRHEVVCPCPEVLLLLGLVGLLIVFGLLLFNDKETFIAEFNAGIPSVYGLAEGVDYYADTIAAGQAAGSTFGSLGVIALGACMAMVPMMTFFNLWPNWGSTLYGEVRGATDYKRNFWGMAAAIIVTAGLALIFFALINKTMGWDFYINANGAFWSNVFYGTAVPIPVWPYPVQFATFLTNSRALQFIIVFLVGLWWFGWSGTVFLSSTRVIFAAAFDRMLPEWVSKIEPRTKHPDQCPAVDGDSLDHHLLPVRLQHRGLQIHRAGCHAGHRHHLLRHHPGGHLAPLEAEGDLRWIADRALHSTILVELAGHAALRGCGGLSHLPVLEPERAGLRHVG